MKQVIKQKRVKNVKVVYKGETHEVEFGTYFDGRTAITLVKENGEPVEVTVNLPELGMPEDSVFIKDSMVDEGVVEALQEADVLSFKITSVDHQGAVS